MVDFTPDSPDSVLGGVSRRASISGGLLLVPGAASATTSGAATSGSTSGSTSTLRLTAGRRLRTPRRRRRNLPCDVANLHRDVWRSEYPGHWQALQFVEFLPGHHDGMEK